MTHVIQWKTKRGLWDHLNPDENTLGIRWLANYQRRNQELVQAKNPKKFKQNCADHVTHVAFERQYNQLEAALIKSSNAVRFDTPKHIDRHGIKVDEANAYGLPVIIKYIHPENVFACDETSDNIHGKDDVKQGGEKRFVPLGNVLKCLVGVSNSHFMILLICNLKGELVLVVVIFEGKKFQAVWGLGVDIFVKELEGNIAVNFIGPGKRYPGLSISCEGKEVFVYFNTSENASMTSSRNMDPMSSAATPPTQRNLLTAGTVRMLGEEEVTLQAVERASQTLNFTGHTSSDIMTLCLQQKARDVGQY